MLAWSTTQWAIVILAFLAGFFIGTLFCTGRKWKRRYKEEVTLREDAVRRRDELERERAHWEAQSIANRARDPR
ncbi:MAG TPA: hypothetical protein VNT77_09365 [Allosphingosinicella sp.]|nr:hypothetical protein [Allosphingosinicella sp.]